MTHILRDDPHIACAIPTPSPFDPLTGIDFYLSALEAIKKIGPREGEADGLFDDDDLVILQSENVDGRDGWVDPEDDNDEAESEGEGGDEGQADVSVDVNTTDFIDEWSEEADEEVEFQGERAELLHTVHKFIQDWDHSVLAVSPSVRVASAVTCLV